MSKRAKNNPETPAQPDYHVLASCPCAQRWLKEVLGACVGLLQDRRGDGPAVIITSDAGSQVIEWRTQSAALAEAFKAEFPNLEREVASDPARFGLDQQLPTWSDVDQAAYAEWRERFGTEPAPVTDAPVQLSDERKAELVEAHDHARLQEIRDAYGHVASAKAEMDDAEQEMETAKARFKARERDWQEAVEQLCGVIRGDDMPLFNQAKEPEPASPAESPDAQGGDDDAPEATPGEDADATTDVPALTPADQKPADPNAWRRHPIGRLSAHGLSAKLLDRLGEAGLNTIGQLEDYRAEQSGKGVSPWWSQLRGVGEAKGQQIDDAITAWFAAHPRTKGDAVAA